MPLKPWNISRVPANRATRHAPLATAGMMMLVEPWTAVSVATPISDNRLSGTMAPRSLTSTVEVKSAVFACPPTAPGSTSLSDPDVAGIVIDKTPSSLGDALSAVTG